MTHTFLNPLIRNSFQITKGTPEREGRTFKILGLCIILNTFVLCERVYKSVFLIYILSYTAFYYFSVLCFPSGSKKCCSGQK